MPYLLADLLSLPNLLPLVLLVAIGVVAGGLLMHLVLLPPRPAPGTPVPAVGRIVRYVPQTRPRDVHAAIITQVHPTGQLTQLTFSQAQHMHYHKSLHALLPGSRPVASLTCFDPGACTSPASYATGPKPYDAHGAPGTWHWPSDPAGKRPAQG